MTMTMTTKCRLIQPLAVSLLFLVSIAAGSSETDSCIDYSLQENFERMDVVFTGTVRQKQNTSKRERRKIDWGAEFSDPEIPILKVRFKVHEEWKGELGKHVTVYTVNPRKSSFGYDFKNNGKYVVFARLNGPGDNGGRREDGEALILTSWCSQNLELGSESRKRKQSSDRLKAFVIERNTPQHVYEEKNPFLRGVDDIQELNSQLTELKSNVESTTAKGMQPDRTTNE